MELYVTQGLSTFGSALLYTGCCQILTCIRIHSLQCDSGPLYSHCQKLQRIEYKTTRPSIPPVHTEKGDCGADQIIHQPTNPFTTACLRSVQVQSKANTNTRAFNSPQIYWLISTVLKYGNSISYPNALLYHTCASGVTQIRAPALSLASHNEGFVHINALQYVQHFLSTTFEIQVFKQLPIFPNSCCRTSPLLLPVN